eukprot:Polyplicarium_translucidae@DN3919_c0_g1_i1.p1
MHHSLENVIRFNMDYDVDLTTLRPDANPHVKEDTLDETAEAAEDPTFMSIKEWIFHRMKEQIFLLWYDIFDVPIGTCASISLFYVLYVLVVNIGFGHKMVLGTDTELSKAPWKELIGTGALQTYASFACGIVLWCYQVLLSFNWFRLKILSGIVENAAEHAEEFIRILITAVWVETTELPMSQFIDVVKSHVDESNFREAASEFVEKSAKLEYESHFHPKKVRPPSEDHKGALLATMNRGGRTY